MFSPSFIKHVMNTSSGADTVVGTRDTDTIPVFGVHAARDDETHAHTHTRWWALPQIQGQGVVVTQTCVCD